MRNYPLFLAGKTVECLEKKAITSPYSGEVLAQMGQASPEQAEQAIVAAQSAFQVYRFVSRYTRSKLLAAMARLISERRAEFVSRLVEEAGKPYGLADGEVGRAGVTFSLASEEARRIGGEVLSLDQDPASRAYAPAVVHWVPRGPVLAITPFNFPLNLVAHKVAPALAAGCSVILKPPPQAPGASVLLAEIFEKAAREVSDSRDSIPLSTIQVIQGSNEVIELLVRDPRVPTLSFTGSDKVGFHLQSKAVGKKVALELGGNAGVVVNADADLARAAARVAFGAFAYAGQVCISVQRVLVHQSVATEFEKLLLEEVKKIGTGDPSRKDVVVGPVIDATSAARILSWVDEAKAKGAQVIEGGTRQGNVIAPTIVKGALPQTRLSCEEVFGPVVLLDTFDRFEEAIERINESRFGLQAGVFTSNLKSARLFAERIEAGGILINEVPTYRADNMPYGGVKDSGLGREGLRYAIEDFSERKVIVEWVG